MPESSGIARAGEGATLHALLGHDMDLEVLWYETLPYIYGITGVIAIAARPGSLLLKLSGVLLIVAALTIVRMRRAYRQAQFAKAATPSSLARDPFSDPFSDPSHDG